MNKYKRLVSNTLIFAAGTFTSKVLVLLLMPLYTSILSTEEYGISDLITQTANLIIPLACVGISDAIFRFTIDCEDKKKVFSTAISVIFVGSALLVVLSPLLKLVGYFDGYVWLICAYVICANLHSACAQFVRAQGRSAAFAVQGIINTSLTIIYNIIFLVVFDMGVVGYVLSVVLADLTVTLGMFLILKLYREMSFRRFDRETLRDMLKFSIPYIPTSMLWLVTSVSDRFVVTYFCGEGVNGLYSAAYKIPTLLTLVCGVFIEAWQISAVRDGEAGEARQSFFGTVYKDYLCVMIAGASFLIASSQIFTKILLAESYFISWEYVPILAISTMFSALSSFMGSVYFLEKKSVYSMLTAFSGAVINVILNFVMIPKHGAMGASVATLISYMTVYAIRVVDTKRFVRFNTHDVKLTLNVILLLLQSVIMCSGVRYSVYVSAAIFALVAVLNLRGIITTIMKILSSFLKKTKK